MTPKDKRREIEERWAAATAGPWEAEVKRLRGIISAVEDELRSLDRLRYAKQGREAEWTRYITSKIRKALSQSPKRSSAPPSSDHSPPDGTGPDGSSAKTKVNP